MTVYQNRIVAYVDVLGFKDLIKRSENDPELQYGIKNITDIFQGKRDISRGLERVVSIMSDSIVISYPYDEERFPLTELVRDVYFVQNSILKLGYLTRGGIAHGSLYHKEQIMFGPAFVDAYQYETGLAIYPRVVLRKSTRSKFIETKFGKNSSSWSRQAVHTDLSILQDSSDTVFYVDYLQHYGTPDEWNGLRALIERRKKDSSLDKKPEIRIKWLWLNTYFNQNCESHGCTTLSTDKSSP